jgi:hypothetical protein
MCVRSENGAWSYTQVTGHKNQGEGVAKLDMGYWGGGQLAVNGSLKGHTSMSLQLGNGTESNNSPF